MSYRLLYACLYAIRLITEGYVLHFPPIGSHLMVRWTLPLLELMDPSSFPISLSKIPNMLIKMEWSTTVLPETALAPFAAKVSGHSTHVS